MVELQTPTAAAAWLRSRVAGSLQTDSRRVRLRDGFVAWPGATTDARRHVKAAIGNGASACLVESSGVEQFEFSDPIVASYQGRKAASGPIASAFL
jgi:UDP-N-acetylmuramoyl-L-alanyl-D-glutamate--2,6-diaminopimelate ligase